MPPQDPTLINPRPHWMRWVLIGITAVFVVACVAAAAYYYTTRVMKHTLPGTMAISFSTPWQAPDKEVLYGLINYDPGKDSYANMTTLQQGIIYSYRKGSLSPDGTSLFATQMMPAETALSIFSIPAQHVATTVDSRSSGAFFTSFHWSGDGKMISYLVYPNVDTKTIATDRKPYLTLQDGVYVPRAGATLPPQLLPTGYVAQSDGSHRSSLGNANPNTFSPDKSMILIQDSRGLAIISLKDGKRQRVTGVTFPTGVVSIFYDPTGQHIAVMGAKDPIIVYKIDWNNAKLVKVGTTKERPTDAVFGSNGKLLAFEGSPSVAAVYSFNVTGMSRQTYQTTLPGKAQLVSWISK